MPDYSIDKVYMSNNGERLAEEIFGDELDDEMYNYFFPNDEDLEADGEEGTIQTQVQSANQ